jgi:hypothetical protein
MNHKIIAAMLAVAFASPVHAARVASDEPDLTSWDTMIPAEIKKCAEAGGEKLTSSASGVVCEGTRTEEFSAPKGFERWVHGYQKLREVRRDMLLCDLRKAGARINIDFGIETSGSVFRYGIFACDSLPGAETNDKVSVSIYTTAPEPEKLTESDLRTPAAERAVAAAVKRCADAGGIKLSLKHDGNVIKSYCQATVFSYPFESAQHGLFEVLRNDAKKMKNLCSLSEHVRDITFTNESMRGWEARQVECRAEGVKVLLRHGSPPKK